MREIVYRERDGGAWRYWTYTEGGRVYLGAREAERMIAQGARLVRV